MATAKQQTAKKLVNILKGLLALRSSQPTVKPADWPNAVLLAYKTLQDEARALASTLSLPFVSVTACLAAAEAIAYEGNVLTPVVADKGIGD